MKAMIFAAGRGTRLQPLTHTTPKALVVAAGKTMLEHVAEKLIRAGVRQIVVNIHHHAGQMKAFIARMQYPGVQIHISDESGQLLDTGGGLVQAKQHLDGEEPFFVYNADVLCDINLQAMLREHQRNQPLATLAVSRRNTSRYLLVDSQNYLTGWENISTGEKILAHQGQGPLQQMAFSGIHLIEPAIFPLITAAGSFPILPEYLRLAGDHPICCFQHDPAYWADLGTPQKLQAARQLYEKNPGRFR